MTDFKRALDFTLRWEGGLSDNPNDRGGLTMQGVTQATYDRWRKAQKLPARSVRELERPELEAIYERGYWRASGAHLLAWPLCLVVFDLAVHSGPGMARKTLARARRLWGERATDLDLARAVIDLRVTFLYGIVRTRDSQRVFLRGWLNRVRDLKELIGY